MTHDAPHNLPHTPHDATSSRDSLEHSIAMLSAPTHDGHAIAPSQLWKNALGMPIESGIAEPRSRGQAWGRWSTLKRFSAIAAVTLLGLVIVSAILPSMGKARSFARVDSRVGEQAPASALADSMDDDSFRAPDEVRVRLPETSSYTRDSKRDSGSAAASAPSDQDTPRYVARKASIDLKTPDVAGAFSKASFLVSDAHGEYIETSSLTGRDDTAAAMLLLRIRPDRLSEVLNGLRKLGDVTSETTGGDDVTDRVVDLDARIRNEQRIERELLELIDKRPDAPLKEILDLRAELSKVRGGIESLIAQRDRLGRLVSLATVLVNIRSDTSAVAPVTASESILDYLQSRTATTFRRATRALVDSITAILGVFIAGAFWWIVIAIVIIAIFRLRRRAIRRAAHEPPPVG